jgi:hypothetical protein
MKKIIFIAVFIYSSSASVVIQQAPQPFAAPRVLYKMVRSMTWNESIFSTAGKTALSFFMASGTKKRDKKEKDIAVPSTYSSPLMRSLLLTLGAYLMIYDRGKIPITLLTYLQTAGEAVLDSDVVEYGHATFSAMLYEHMYRNAFLACCALGCSTHAIVFHMRTLKTVKALVAQSYATKDLPFAHWMLNQFPTAASIFRDRHRLDGVFWSMFQEAHQIESFVQTSGDYDFTADEGDIWYVQSIERERQFLREQDAQLAVYVPYLDGIIKDYYRKTGDIQPDNPADQTYEQEQQLEMYMTKVINYNSSQRAPWYRFWTWWSYYGFALKARWDIRKKLDRLDQMHCAIQKQYRKKYPVKKEKQAPDA